MHTTGSPEQLGRSWINLVPRQFLALTRKNLLSRARDWQLNLSNLAQAVLFVLLIWIVDRAVSFSNQQSAYLKAERDPAPVPVGSLTPCAQDTFLQAASCVTLLYTPKGQPLVERIIADVRRSNQPALSPAEVQGFDSQSQVDQWLWEHPESTAAAVHFTVLGPQAMQFVVQTNSSVRFFKGSYQDPTTHAALPLQVAVEAAFTRLALQRPSLPWRVSIKDFPHPQLQENSRTGRIAPVFILASLMFNFVAQLTALAHEADSGARQALAASGMLDSAYWASAALLELLLAALQATIIVGMTWALRFDLALKNSIALLWLLIWLTGTALSGMGLLAAALVRRPGLATPLAFALYILAWVFQLVISLGFPYAPGVHWGLLALFSLFPWSLLSKGFADLARAAEGSGAGISWQQRYSYCQEGTPSPEEVAQLAYWSPGCTLPVAQALWVLALQYCGYALLALYLDNVLQAPHRPARHPLYFLTPSYWLPSAGSTTAAAQAALEQAQAANWWRACQEATSNTAGRAATAGSFRQDQVPDTGGSEEGLVLGHSAGRAAAAACTSATVPAAAGGTDAVDCDVLREEEEVQQICRRYIRCVEGGSLVHHPSAADLSADDVRRSYTWPGEEDGGIVRGAPAETAGAGAGAGVGSAACDSSLGPAGLLQTLKHGVVLFGLRKVYESGSRLLRRRTQHVAVQGTWLAIPPGQCFALLGPNGAGKTTTISCLTGLTRPTSGDALIAGHSISSPGGVDRVRASLGVCFQFDVLWPKLTGREHMELVAAMRGLGGREGREQVEELLQQVNLTSAADVRAGSYSGGMRRRLSLALALLGRPSVLVLDEPTTGMDPISRRAVWEMLNRYKQGRVLLLTTHSMEEADTLGDRIAVFAGGRLRCLGTSLHLKARHGSGYRLSIGLRPDSAAAAVNSMAAASHDEPSCSGAAGASASGSSSSSGGTSAVAAQAGQQARLAVEQLVSQVLGQPVEAEAAGELGLQFQLPAGCEARLAEVLQQLQLRAEQLGVADVQVGMAPLEEVFLAVADNAKKQE